VFDCGIEIFQFVHQLPRYQQGQCVQRAGDRAFRRCLRRAGMPGRHDDQALCAFRDGHTDRRIARNRTIGQIDILVPDRRESAGDRGTGNDRLRDRPLGKHHAVARNDICGDDVEGEPGLLEIAIGDVIVDQLPDTVVRDQKIPPPQEAQHRPHRERENILPPQAAPDRLQLQHTLEGRIAGIIGAVDGPDAGADHHVREDPVRGERVHHADLNGAKAAAAGQHEGGVLEAGVGYGQGVIAPAGRRAGACFPARRSAVLYQPVAGSDQSVVIPGHIELVACDLFDVNPESRDSGFVLWGALLRGP
jgi:hypothetical protein